MEKAIKSSTVCPPTSKEDVNRVVLEKTKEAAAEKIRAMTNRAEAAYYGEEDSIATMEEGVELKSTSEHGSVVTTSKSSMKHNPCVSVTTNPFLADDKSIASPVTWETMISKQSQTDARLDKVDSTLDKILQFMQSGQTSNLPPNSSVSETGSQQHQSDKSSANNA